MNTRTLSLLAVFLAIPTYVNQAMADTIFFKGLEPLVIEDPDAEAKAKDPVRFAKCHGKKVAVDVKITQEKSGGVIAFDASGSTTPSGKIQYNWIAGTFLHHDSSKATNTTHGDTPGTYRLMDFSIADPYCGFSQQVELRVHSK